MIHTAPLIFSVLNLHIEHTMTCMSTLCMFIYTVIIIQHVLIWDFNSQPHCSQNPVFLLHHHVCFSTGVNVIYNKGYFEKIGLL
jgi:hypothetical protein